MQVVVVGSVSGPGGHPTPAAPHLFNWLSTPPLLVAQTLLCCKACLHLWMWWAVMLHLNHLVGLSMPVLHPIARSAVALCVLWCCVVIVSPAGDTRGASCCPSALMHLVKSSRPCCCILEPVPVCPVSNTCDQVSANCRPALTPSHVTCEPKQHSAAPCSDAGPRLSISRYTAGVLHIMCYMNASACRQHCCSAQCHQAVEHPATGMPTAVHACVQA
jgi:hypothetical protein